MPSSKQPKHKARGEVVPPLSVLDRIDSILKEHLRIFQSKGDLSEAEIEHWHRDLSPWPIAAIEWAFDNWRRNGRFFPVYGDILDLCVAWEPPVQQSRTCDDHCRRGHYRAYSWNHGDLQWLLVKVGDLLKGRPHGSRLTAIEWNGLLDELDSKRPGGAPLAAAEWRR